MTPSSLTYSSIFFIFALQMLKHNFIKACIWLCAKALGGYMQTLNLGPLS